MKDIDIIIHLAGQAGVRYSIFNPETYILNNILVYVKLLEFFKLSKKLKVILYASSSSVYGEKGEKNNQILVLVNQYQSTQLQKLAWS